MKIILLIVSVCFYLIANSQKLSPEIVGGIEVREGDAIAKRTVMLTGEYTRFSYTCSGVIIAPDLVLTAAHCLGPYGAAKITAFFGVNKDKSGVTYKVIKQIMPSDYSITPSIDRNDIALLLLEKLIPVGYEAAKIISAADLIHAGDVATVAGFGINQILMPSGGGGGMGVLRFAEQNILDVNYGKKEILLSLKGRGTCNGDSGGPVFYKKNNELLLFGAASRMTDKDIVPGSKPVRYECTEEVVYTSVLAHAEWLKAAEAELRKN